MGKMPPGWLVGHRLRRPQSYVVPTRVFLPLEGPSSPERAPPGQGDLRLPDSGRLTSGPLCVGDTPGF